MSGSEGHGDENNDDLMAEWAAAGTQLDQNSIDSLFGESPGAGAGVASNPRRGLELLIGNAIVGYERLPMLDIVVDRFARLLTTSTRKFTGDNCDVSVGRTRATRVGDFLNQISLPALIGVIRAEDWDGYILVTMDAPLIGSVVDVLLGGRRNHAQPIEGRPYTPIERTLVERLVGDVVIQDLERAFESVCAVHFTAERYETTPSYAAITELSAAAVTFRAEVAMDGGRGGFMDFLVPYATIEPVRDILAREFIGKKAQGDTLWRNHLHEEVPQATVEIHAVLEQRMIPVHQVAGWQPGSLLMLDRKTSDPVDLLCEDVLVARAQLGEQDGKIALQVLECMNLTPSDLEAQLAMQKPDDIEPLVDK